MSIRRYDLVLYGATGFVGRLTAAHLAQYAPAGTRIALAGRSQERLEAVRGGLPGSARHWPLVVADASNPDEVRDLALSTKAVVTTVGPSARYGVPLATACAQGGTHYADLTGEVLFVRDLADSVHDAAVKSGARVVVSCGFDSVPSDLGVWMLHRRAAADGAGGLLDTTLLVTRMRGGFSGGTIDSMRAQFEALGEDPARRAVVFDPFALSPDRDAEPAGAEAKAHRDLLTPYRDEATGQWTAPFVMATYNTRVVRRSNALLTRAGDGYGPRFRYREAMGLGVGPAARAKAYGVTGGLGLAMAGMSAGATRSVLDRVLPKPGEGPDEQARAAGSFRMELRTTTEEGRRYLAVVAAKGDPGYAATAVMLGESALSLALDPLTSAGGVLTPAVAMGDALVERLRARAFTLTVDPE